MSDRAVRAAEWSAFASLLEERATNVKRAASATGSTELTAVAIALIGVSADATKLAEAIRRSGPETEPEGVPS